jgi:hypothetical protein
MMLYVVFGGDDIKVSKGEVVVVFKGNDVEDSEGEFPVGCSTGGMISPFGRWQLKS